MNKFRTSIMKASAVLLSLALVLNACKKDDPAPVPAPTVSTGNTEVSGIPGATVDIKATINAPGGIASITVLKNGAPFENKTANGETSLEYKGTYKIEDNLAAGAVVNFTIQAIDKSNQSSNLVTIPVKITAIPPKPIIEVKGTLTGDVKWTAGNIYKLIGFVRVGEDLTITGTPTKTGVLTIEPGTLVIGQKSTKGTLVIQRGSKIIAEGTVDKPIVMTSEVAPGQREAGDWGGLVICGRAKTNLGNGELEGAYGGFFGGTDDADNSGSLKYVRVEYAGIPINPNQEVNSFTFGAVGAGTTIQYCQASYGLDDSFEWFGGTVNAQYLIAYRGQDDDFDTDNGFSGYVQYGVGIRAATIADQSGSNGFESDNDADGSTKVPFTSAIFANMSIIGAKNLAETSINVQFQNGVQIRRNSKQKLYNTFITGYPNGVYIDSQKGTAKDFAAAGDIVLDNVILAGVTGWGTNGWGLGFATAPRGAAVPSNEQNATATAFTIGGKTAQEWFLSGTGNKILANTANTGISTTVWQPGKPTFLLNAGTTESLIGPKLNAKLPAWFEATDFVGAFKDKDWTATWAEFSPQTVVYVK